MIQKKYTIKIIGIIMLFVNVLLLYGDISHFYRQNFAGVLVFIYIPTWVLLACSLLAIIGIVISIRLLKNKISILEAVLWQLLIIILRFAIFDLHILLRTA